MGMPVYLFYTKIPLCPLLLGTARLLMSKNIPPCPFIGATNFLIPTLPVYLFWQFVPKIPEFFQIVLIFSEIFPNFSSFLMNFS